MAKTGNQTQQNCVETIDLTHKFPESETALSSVNLQFIEGSIYGFLGLNGSGNDDAQIDFRAFVKTSIKIKNQIIPISESYKQRFFSLVKQWAKP